MPLYLGVLGNLLPRLQPDVGFFPIRPVAGKLAAAPQFAGIIHVRTSATFTLNSCSTAAFTKVLLASTATSKHSVRSLSFFVDALFGHHRPFDYFVDGHFASASESFRAAACESSTPVASSA